MFRNYTQIDGKLCLDKDSGSKLLRWVRETYSVSDNKVGPSRERCWLSTRAQLLETKVTAVCTGTGEGRSGTAPELHGEVLQTWSYSALLYSVILLITSWNHAEDKQVHFNNQQQTGPKIKLHASTRKSYKDNNTSVSISTERHHVPGKRKLLDFTFRIPSNA